MHTESTLRRRALRLVGIAAILSMTVYGQAISPSASDSLLAREVVIAISTVYRRSGLLYSKWRDYAGRPGDILVIKAPSRVFNPTLDEADIAADKALDPERGGGGMGEPLAR